MLDFKVEEQHGTVDRDISHKISFLHSHWIYGSQILPGSVVVDISHCKSNDLLVCAPMVIIATSIRNEM